MVLRLPRCPLRGSVSAFAQTDRSHYINLHEVVAFHLRAGVRTLDRLSWLRIDTHTPSVGGLSRPPTSFTSPALCVCVCVEGIQIVHSLPHASACGQLLRDPVVLEGERRVIDS